MRGGSRSRHHPPAHAQPQLAMPQCSAGQAGSGRTPARRLEWRHWKATRQVRAGPLQPGHSRRRGLLRGPVGRRDHADSLGNVSKGRTVRDVTKKACGSSLSRSLGLAGHRHGDVGCARGPVGSHWVTAALVFTDKRYGLQFVSING